MIINSAPDNQAILSNVSQIDTFSIKTSARAFEILSSGLYANKIRAIIRELSCNAYDSHIAAEKTCPFDVHLPNYIEPWFSIRDYGIGLDHNQVMNIYTTYFESTKTDSNDYVGALGLGSKSPFSYTNNFTVTAIKNHRKGIYTAFINENGVPSIALMMEESTNDSNGLEVKFSVNNSSDYNSFRYEAQKVFSYFQSPPNVSGSDNFVLEQRSYEQKNIVFGIHSLNNTRKSIAVMGNIPYPIDIPASSQLKPHVTNLLNCGLEIHFEIGELDFQASREGLSYNPQTINAITNRLDVLNNNLTKILIDEIETIDNLWKLTDFLIKKKSHPLWNSAVTDYARNTNFKCIHISSYGFYPTTFNFLPEKLAEDYNISIRGFVKKDFKTIELKTKDEYSNINYKYEPTWKISCDINNNFVINDTKIGALERAKYHWRNNPRTVHNQFVYVLNTVDQTRPAKFNEFFKALENPPDNIIFKASELMTKPRNVKKQYKNISILMLNEDNNSKFTWSNAGSLDNFDDTIHYYIPLKGYQIISSYEYTNIDELMREINNSPITDIKVNIYGVRKSDIEQVKQLSNWINIEDHISTVLSKSINDQFINNLAQSEVGKIFNNILKDEYIIKLSNHSLYRQTADMFNKSNTIRCNVYSFQKLIDRFIPNDSFNIEMKKEKYNQQIIQVSKKYPMLKHVHRGNRDVDYAIIEYIKLIDQLETS